MHDSINMQKHNISTDTRDGMIQGTGESMHHDTTIPQLYVAFSTMLS